jgi:hypothetical protein
VGAARAERSQAALTAALGGLHARDVMTPEPDVAADLTRAVELGALHMGHSPRDHGHPAVVNR